MSGNTNVLGLYIFFTPFSDIRHAELAKINFLHSGLEAQVNVVGTDVAGYLQSEYEKKIISSIEKIQKEVKRHRINNSFSNVAILD